VLVELERPPLAIKKGVKRAEWKLLAKSERAPLAIEEGVERADWSRDEDCDLKEEQSLLWIKGGVPLLAEEVDLREPLRVLMLWGAIPPAGVVVLLFWIPSTKVFVVDGILFVSTSNPLEAPYMQLALK
jgi:hypothetical protein